MLDNGATGKYIPAIAVAPDEHRFSAGIVISSSNIAPIPSPEHPDSLLGKPGRSNNKVDFPDS
jgi:hypothetical protein